MYFSRPDLGQDQRPSQCPTPCKAGFFTRETLPRVCRNPHAPLHHITSPLAQLQSCISIITIANFFHGSALNFKGCFFFFCLVFLHLLQCCSEPTSTERGIFTMRPLSPRSGEQTEGCLRHRMTAVAPAARPGRGRTLPSLCTSGNRRCCRRGYVSFVERALDGGGRFTAPIPVAMKVHACVYKEGKIAPHPFLRSCSHSCLV